MNTTGATGSYLSRFEELERDRGVASPSWLRGMRRSAIDRFTDVGFPTTRDERWRKTNVAPIAATAFVPSEPDIRADAPATSELQEALDRISLGVGDALRIVFVGGRLAPALSTISPLPAGVRLMNLAEVLRAEPGLVESHLGRSAPPEDHPFGALNTGLFDEGAFVLLPRGVNLARPVHVIYMQIGGDVPVVAHPRTLIVAEAGSRATIVECYVGAGKGKYLTNAVTELVLGDGAVIDHYKVQVETREAFHIAVTGAMLSRDSTLTSHSVSIGGAIVRNDLSAVLGATGADCTLNGLFLAGDAQLVDNHTTIDHAKPHGTSRELYKGVLDGRSRGVFDGRIIVRPDAQKTDARQANRNLLLSEDALIDTKPQLEILNDDVKCSHAATIGRLDEGALFYLRSRGIDARAARDMLMKAFASDVLSGVKIASLRAGLEEAVSSWLARKGGNGVTG